VKGTSHRRAKFPRAEQGYAFLIVVFFTTVLLISALAVSSSIRVNDQREKEEEMVWRGNQYVRGIKLFYRKNNRFPTSLDDLTKPQVGSLRFMRQSFKDPMNTEDGSWRLLYVGPNGQLLGSLKPQSPSVLLPNSSGFGTPASALGTTAAQPGGFGSQQSSTAPAGPASGGQTSTTPGTTPANGQTDPMLNPPADSGMSSTIVGGNIIGVGGKINRPSLRIYEKAKNYKLFEFYWDPSKDVAAALQNGLQPGGVPGGTPIGAPISAPGSPNNGPLGNPGGFGGTPQPPTQAPQPTPQQ
jgi:hypothetical protein